MLAYNLNEEEISEDLPLFMQKLNEEGGSFEPLFTNFYFNRQESQAHVLC